MIRPIDIKINAAHPELPLAEASAYTGAPSTVLIRGVPGSCGKWAITAVQVCATFPDNATVCREAVQSANGVWVATLPGSSTSGRTRSGLWITASGVDENGAAVTGYILGVADFAVYALGTAPAPAPGGTSYAMHYFESLPTAANEGDVALDDNVWKIYNGDEWDALDARAFALAQQIVQTLQTSYYTSAQTDEAIERVAAYYITFNAAGAAFPTRADLLNAQTYYSGGSVRVPTRNDYAIVAVDETHNNEEWRYIYAENAQGVGQWEPQYSVEGVIAFDDNVTRTSGNGVKSSGIWAAIWGALAALPTGFSSLYDWCVSQLSGKASTADATLTERGFSEWTFVPATFERDGETYEWSDYAPRYEPVQFEYEGSLYNPGWYGFRPDGEQGPWEWTGDGPNALTLTTIAPEGEEVTATRTALPGYQLGSQSGKPIASEAEAEAIRTAVAGKLASSDVIDPATATASGKAADALATKNALAARPTKSQLDEGWWSEWEFSGLPEDVTVDSMEWAEGASKWVIYISIPATADTASADSYGNDGEYSSIVQFAGIDIGPYSLDVTATRHRVAAPVPTKPEDIGAASRAADPTAGHLAALDANGNPTDSGKSASDFMPAGAKIQRIYNAGGTDALDDKGQLYKSSISVGYWATYSSTGEFYRNLYFTGVTDGVYRWDYSGGTYYVTYNDNNGEIRVYPNTKIATVTSDLDPLSPDCIFPDCPFGKAVYKYTPSTIAVETTPYARFALESMPTAWAASNTYTVGVCVSYSGKAYRCNTQNSDATFVAAKWDEIPVLAQKADTADLRYSFNAATVGTGTTPTVTNVLDRAINSATLDSSVTAATVTLPAATTGRSRDFYIDLTIEAADAPTLTFIDPATGTTANVAFGADSLADIAPGYNIVLFTELPNNRWLVSVKHEEAA